MCDYSLHGIPNRLAKEGETLVVHRFHSQSKGLTSPDYLKLTLSSRLLAAVRRIFRLQPQICAVCVPDGAKLILYDIPAWLRRAHLNPIETVTFRQLSLEAHTYRDAVEFSNGMRVRLQGLEDRQRVEVLTLVSSEKADGPSVLTTDVFGSERL
jgi:hypothetical protein